MIDILTDIERIINSENLTEIENAIAKEQNCKVYKDNIQLLIGFIKKEVEICDFSLTQIENYLKNNSNQIINFSRIFLEKSNVSTLSIGISISYSIYLLYLKNKTEDNLLSFIKNRRIPQAKKLVKELLLVKSSLENL